MPDDAMGERVKAVVVKQDESLTAAALRRHAAAKLADFKVPPPIEVHGPGRPAHDGLGQVAKAALKKRDAKLAEERKAAREPQAGGPAPPGIADHAYGVTWVDATAAEAAAAVEGFWVLLDDGTGVAQELAAKTTGATAAILPPPGGRRRAGEGARACALEESGEDVAGVVCLTALGAGAALGDDVAGATKPLKTPALQALDGATTRRVELGTAPPPSRAESAWRKRRRKAPARALPVPRLLEGGPVADATSPRACTSSPAARGLGVEWAAKLAAAGGKAATLVLAAAPSPELAAARWLASDTGATVVVEQADVSLASGAEALRAARPSPTPATKLARLAPRAPPTTAPRRC
ncbi:hypothetical protein JL721_9508 [Aureococcus anophagefferens]|nr:hypothetical protein JL721_9508 [Aureococcus anophagefferens]